MLQWNSSRRGGEFLYYRRAAQPGVLPQHWLGADTGTAPGDGQALRQLPRPCGGSEVVFDWQTADAEAGAGTARSQANTTKSTPPAAEPPRTVGL